MPVSTPEELTYLKMLLYGWSRSGKTVLAGTAQDDPRTAPTLIVDTEGGSGSLRGRAIDVLRARTWDDYSEAYMLAQQGHYRCVVIDSLSETQSFVFDSILRKDPDKRHDPDLLTKQDFGIALNKMRRFLRQWLDLPIHVIFTAQAKETVDHREGTVIVPKFAGQFYEDASKDVLSLAYLALTTVPPTNEVKRVLLLSNQSKFKVGSRDHLNKHVPDTLGDPTIGKLLDALQFDEKPQSPNGKGKG